MSPRRADRVVILDRDGTLVVDHGYLADPARLEFTVGAAEGLRWLYDCGYRLVLITNQSGVGRGFFSLADVSAVNSRLEKMVENAGAKLERVYFCPHSPAAACSCRKPALGLLRQAVRELDFNPIHATVIGDKASDMQFGRNAGAKTVLIAESEVRDSSADVIAPNMREAAYAVAALCAPV
jgi:D-glycero-D-manno-heptose 1,7-bisphosphate phosphatase